MKTKNQWYLLAIALVLGAGAFVGYAVADEKGPPEGAGAGMMPAWMNTTKEHKNIAKSVGTFDCIYTFIVGPQQMKGTGVAVGKMIMGGRFLQQSFDGITDGHRMQGLATVGFDTIAKEYVTTWIDSMSPFLYVGRGKEKDGAIRYNGRSPEWITGKVKDDYIIMIWQDADHYTMEMGDVLADGSRKKTAFFKYSRRKE